MPLFKKKDDVQQLDAESQSVLAATEGTGQAPLETYKVVYKGGHPDYPKSKVAEIRFLIFSDRFEFIPTNTSKWWSPLSIPYDRVIDLQITDRQVSTVEGLLGGLDSRQLNQKNNIHIIYESGGDPIVLRWEMLSGFSVMGQAKKCLELEDRLNNLGIRKKFKSADSAATIGGYVGPDPMDQLKKLGELRAAGLLTQEEFDKKKVDLLERM
jgi:hypothetical protein